MRPHRALHSSLRIAIVLFVGMALLPVPCVSMLVSALAQGQSQSHSQRNGPPPRPGKPEGTFPNLEDMQNESGLEREPPAPIYSTVRSQRNSGKPWDGRRVGDPEPPSRDVDHPGGPGQTLRAHARRRRTVPVVMYEDQFIQNFFTVGLGRSATYDETLYWNYQFRAAYNNGAASLKLAAIEQRTMRNKPIPIGFFVILLCAAAAQAKGWRGIVPLHSTRSQVEQLLGLPTEQSNPYSVVYKTPNETVEIDYATGGPCGIGEKYSPWRVARDTVTEIFISPIPGSPLSKFTIDESKYKKFIVGHLSEIRYINDSEGEALTMGFDNEVRSISYFAATDDSNLECPGLPQPNKTNCEYIPDPFISLGGLGFEQEKLFLDNFYLALSKRTAIAYIIVYGGKRARPNEAKQRADRAKKYLIAVRHYPADHIKVIDGGYREKPDLELYIVSEGVCPPTPFPTIDPRDVQITKR